VRLPFPANTHHRRTLRIEKAQQEMPSRDIIAKGGVRFIHEARRDCHRAFLLRLPSPGNAWCARIRGDGIGQYLGFVAAGALRNTLGPFETAQAAADALIDYLCGEG
jgi:hypothetical protein